MIRFNYFTQIQSDKELQELSEMLHVAYQDTYEFYQRKIIDKYGFNAFPYAGADPYILEAESNYRYRFTEILMPDGDKVAIFFKVYSMYGAHGSYLWFKPLSYNDNYDNEKLVFKHLSENNIINNIEIPKVFHNINYKQLNQRSDDYYCFVAERYKEVNKSKYRSAKGINKIRNSYNIVFQVNEFDPDEIQKLSYYWWKLHKKPNYPFDKHLQPLLDLPNNKRWVLTWKMDDKLLGFTLITKHFADIPVARIQHNRNILKTEVDTGDDFLLAHLADYMHYCTIQFLHDEGYKVAYIGDAYGAGRYLAPYKARNFKYKVDNYDLPICRYNELYEEEN